MPYWKQHLPGLEVGDLVVLNGGGGDEWWVGKVLELLEVVWNEKKSITGDMVVHEYNGVGKGAKFEPSYSLDNTPVVCCVWSHCCDQWGSEDRMLDSNSKHLLLNVMSALGTPQA